MPNFVFASLFFGVQYMYKIIIIIKNIIMVCHCTILNNILLQSAQKLKGIYIYYHIKFNHMHPPPKILRNFN